VHGQSLRWCGGEGLVVTLFYPFTEATNGDLTIGIEGKEDDEDAKKGNVDRVAKGSVM